MTYVSLRPGELVMLAGRFKDSHSPGLMHLYSAPHTSSSELAVTATIKRGELAMVISIIDNGTLRNVLLLSCVGGLGWISGRWLKPAGDR